VDVGLGRRMDKVSKEEEANGDGQVVELAQEGAPEAHPTFSLYSVMSFLDIEDRANYGSLLSLFIKARRC
jgi:hypothetical protein